MHVKSTTMAVGKGGDDSFKRPERGSYKNKGVEIFYYIHNS